MQIEGDKLVVGFTILGITLEVATLDFRVICVVF